MFYTTIDYFLLIFFDFDLLLIEDEVLEVVATLADAKEYIAEYGQYHDDLFVYDKDTNELVLTSNKNE